MSKGVEATPLAEGAYHMRYLPWLWTMYHLSPLVILSIMRSAGITSTRRDNTPF